MIGLILGSIRSTRTLVVGQDVYMTSGRFGLSGRVAEVNSDGAVIQATVSASGYRSGDLLHFNRNGISDEWSHDGGGPWEIATEKRVATPEEIKQRDEEWWLRKKYWHVLFYVDSIPDIASGKCEFRRSVECSDRAYYDDIAVIRKHLEPYDLDSMCDLTTTPNHECTCAGAGISKRK